MKFKKICIVLIFSQIYFLGVFGAQNNEYFVIEASTNLCGIFIKGNAKNPNWLPEGWKSIDSDVVLSQRFATNEYCKIGNVEKCCKENNYKYAGTPIGVRQVSGQREDAEYLASKSIIATHTYSPSSYELENTITRKEVMKVIMNISGDKLDNICREIYADVKNDWACKYIEGALEAGYIASNGAFRPDETITQSEALKLILQVSKISKRYNTGSWQQDYISTAYYLGVIPQKFSQYNIPATRGWIFSAAAKSLKLK